MSIKMITVYRCTLAVITLFIFVGNSTTASQEDIPDCCRKEYEALMRRLRAKPTPKREPSTLAAYSTQAKSSDPIEAVITPYQSAYRTKSTRAPVQKLAQLPNPETVLRDQRTRDRPVINYQHRAQAFDSANLRRAAARPDLVVGLAQNYEPPKHLGPLKPCPRPPPIQLFFAPRTDPINMPPPPPPPPFEKRLDHYVF